jgi:hypothetical protein
VAVAELSDYCFSNTNPTYANGPENTVFQDLFEEGFSNASPPSLFSSFWEGMKFTNFIPVGRFLDADFLNRFAKLRVVYWAI